jgi:hypothetical protein
VATYLHFAPLFDSPCLIQSLLRVAHAGTRRWRRAPARTPVAPTCLNHAASGDAPHTPPAAARRCCAAPRGTAHRRRWEGEGAGEGEGPCSSQPWVHAASGCGSCSSQARLAAPLPPWSSHPPSSRRARRRLPRMRGRGRRPLPRAWPATPPPRAPSSPTPLAPTISRKGDRLIWPSVRHERHRHASYKDGDDAPQALL